jgi:menaquinone-dependent protoporphyrinogen IX oxidase
MKGVVIYKGKYGSTRQYAEWLGAELNLPVFIAEDIRIEQLKSYDYLVLGTPVYAGKLLLHAWLRKNRRAVFGKKIFVFIVSGTPPEEKQKLESYVQKSVPEEIRKNSKLYFMRGRMILKQLSFFDRLMLKMGALLTKDEKEKKEMQMEFDDVKKGHLDELLIDIKKFNAIKKEEMHAV